MPPMNESLQELMSSLVPVAALVPLTDEALHALPNEPMRRGLVGINVLPFRVGRESRIYQDEKTGSVHRLERYKPGGQAPNNDLYLLDGGHLLNISREHLQIERREDGFHIVDRKSACGFSVDGKRVGGDGKGGEMPINHDQELCIGSSVSPYRYRFIDFSGFAVTRSG